MPRDTLALIGLGLTLIAAVFGFGLRIGTLTERIEAQTKQIDLMRADLDAVNHGFIVWTINHHD